MVTIRDNLSGATIERTTPLAEKMVTGDPDRYEIVEPIQPSPIVRDAALPPLDSRRRVARRTVPPDDAA